MTYVRRRYHNDIVRPGFSVLSHESGSRIFDAAKLAENVLYPPRETAQQPQIY